MSFTRRVTLCFLLAGCGAQQEEKSPSQPDAIFSESASGKFVFQSGEGHIEDGAVNWQLYENGRIDYSGFVSFFGRETKVVERRCGWYGCDTYEYIKTEFGRLLNSLTQKHFSGSLELLEDEVLLDPNFFRYPYLDYTTHHNVRVRVSLYDAKSNTAVVSVTPNFDYPKSSLSGWLYSYSGLVGLDLSGPITKVQWVKGNIQMFKSGDPNENSTSVFVLKDAALQESAAPPR